MESPSNLELIKNNDKSRIFFQNTGLIQTQVCPRCLNLATLFKNNEIILNHSYFCKICSYHYSNKSHTFFDKSKLKFNIIYLLIKLYCNDFDPL